MLAEGDWEEAPQRPEVHTVRDLLYTWLEHQSEEVRLKRISENTYRAAYGFTKWVDQELGNTVVAAVNLRIVQKAFNRLQERGYAPRSIRQAYKALQGAWNHGRRYGLIDNVELPKPNLPAIEGHVLNHATPTLEEALEIIEAQRGWAKVAMELLLCTGARVGEIEQLNWESSWDMEGRRIECNGKTGPRWVPLAPRVNGLLMEWWLSCGRPQSGSMWPSAYPAEGLRKRLARYDITPHGFRRLASSRLIRGRIDPKTYSDVMGHSFEVGLKWYAESSSESLSSAAEILGCMYT